MRRLLLVAFLAAAPAAAQDAPPAGRFEIVPAEPGFTRLDTRTGAVSHCAPRDDGVWYCEPLDTSADTAEQLDALGASVRDLTEGLAALTSNVDDLAARVDALAERPNTAPTVEASEQPAFADEVVRRFLHMVRRLKGVDSDPA